MFDSREGVELQNAELRREIQRLSESHAERLKDDARKEEELQRERSKRVTDSEREAQENRRLVLKLQEKEEELSLLRTTHATEMDKTRRDFEEQRKDLEKRLREAS